MWPSRGEGDAAAARVRGRGDGESAKEVGQRDELGLAADHRRDLAALLVDDDDDGLGGGGEEGERSDGQHGGQRGSEPDGEPPPAGNALTQRPLVYNQSTSRQVRKGVPALARCTWSDTGPSEKLEYVPFGRVNS